MRVVGVSPVRGVCSIASTTFMPSTTRPNAVYWPSSAVDAPMTDEERRRRAVGRVAARHRHDAFDVLRVVELRREVVNELLLLFGQRRRARVHRAGLNDEARRDAMKRHAVVDARLGQAQELSHRFARLVRKELDRDRAGARVENRPIAARSCTVSLTNGTRRRVADRHAA